MNAQLIDARADHHLWAEKYDGVIEDVFKLQDAITRKIVSALSVKLTNKEQALFSTSGTDNIEAYDLFLKGRGLRFRLTPESFAEAVKLLKKAVELDPNYSQPYAELAMIYWLGASWGGKYFQELGVGYTEGRYRAMSYLELAMRHPTSTAYQVAARVAIARRQFKKAEEEAQKAIELSPNDSDNYYVMAFVYKDAKPEEAIACARMEAKLDPQRLHYSLFRQGAANFFLKHYEKTIELTERAGVHNQTFLQSNAEWVAAYAYLGRIEEAKRIYKDQFLKGYAGFPDPIPEHVIHVNGVQKPETADLLINGLIKAGLPAQPDHYSRLSDAEKLSVEEVKKLAIGRTWTGSLWIAPRVKFWFHWSEDGTRTLKLGGTTNKKEFGFEDDHLYVVNDVEGRKIKSHINIYRRPYGSYEQKNEYILLYEGGVWPFSAEKESQ